VKLGDTASVSFNAYPGMALKGTVSNIGPILDPNIRTAKVRIEVKNPGALRVGMFATATFEGRKKEVHTVVPATSIMHLHDRDWAYIPAPGNRFQRVEVVAGQTFSNGTLEVKSGIKPGQQVVQNTLALQNEIDNQ
jgi:cobalt-zinc-cadmium efflux system membrane fusion protein